MAREVGEAMARVEAQLMQMQETLAREVEQFGEAELGEPLARVEAHLKQTKMQQSLTRVEAQSVQSEAREKLASAGE